MKTAKNNDAYSKIAMKLGVWHDEGDDGITGWQPIGEPLIKR